jgi:serine/threonine protein kinase
VTSRTTRTAGDDFTGLIVAGKWRVRKQIGRGNSTVWLCTDQSAVTPLPPRAAKFIRDEGTVTRRQELDRLKAMGPSEHVITLYDVDRITYGGSRYLVLLLEYCDGGSLERGVASAECEVVASHLIAGLDRIHSRSPQLIHADIKPANILRAGGDWKLADFDISKQVGVGALSATNDGARTPAFMAPGQGDPRHRLTTADDVYSLGATLHYALTGRLLVDRPGLDPVLSGLTPAEWVPFITEACRLIPEARATLPQLWSLIPHRGRQPYAGTTAATAAAQHQRHSGGWIRRAGLLVSAAVLASVLAGGIIVAVQRTSDSPQAQASTASSTPTSQADSAVETTAAEASPTNTGSTSPTANSSSTPATDTAATLPTTATTAATTTAAPTVTTLGVNLVAQDSLTYLKLAKPLNCASYNALLATSGLGSISYWGHTTFSSSNWQDLLDAKPALQAWVDAMNTFTSDPGTAFRTVSTTTLNTQVQRLKNVMQLIIDAQGADEANIAAMSDPQGRTLMGLLDDVNGAAHYLRGDLYLPTDLAPSFSTDCNDYWLV